MKIAIILRRNMIKTLRRKLVIEKRMKYLNMKSKSLNKKKKKSMKQGKLMMMDKKRKKREKNLLFNTNMFQNKSQKKSHLSFREKSPLKRRGEEESRKKGRNQSLRCLCKKSNTKNSGKKKICVRKKDLLNEIEPVDLLLKYYKGKSPPKSFLNSILTWMQLTLS